MGENAANVGGTALTFCGRCMDWSVDSGLLSTTGRLEALEERWT